MLKYFKKSVQSGPLINCDVIVNFHGLWENLYGIGKFAHIPFICFCFNTIQTDTRKAIFVKINKILLIRLMKSTFTSSLSCCLIFEVYGWRFNGNKSKLIFYKRQTGNHKKFQSTPLF